MRITPAYAGNTDLPIYSAASFLGSPPHTRGIRSSLDVPSCIARITPAYAGNTIRILNFINHSWDHPRIRGEYWLFAYYDEHGEGSPPHTRGIRFYKYCITDSIRITPAYAGNTLDFFHATKIYRDHPRIRGEYQFFHNFNTLFTGSPPHTRGILCIVS